MGFRAITKDEADELNAQGYNVQEGQQLEEVTSQQAQPETSPQGGIGRTVYHAFRANVLPSLGGGVGMKAGAALGTAGAAYGAELGLPFGGPIGSAIGAGIGGLGGMLIGSYLGGKATEGIMSDEAKRQLAEEEAAHPWAAKGGALLAMPLGGAQPIGKALPYAGAGAARWLSNITRPVGAEARALLPHEIEALKNVAMGTGLGVAIPAGQELAQGRLPSVGELAEGGLLGATFANPTPVLGKLFGFHPIQPKGVHDVEGFRQALAAQQAAAGAAPAPTPTAPIAPTTPPPPTTPTTPKPTTRPPTPTTLTRIPDDVMLGLANHGLYPEEIYKMTPAEAVATLDKLNKQKATASGATPPPPTPTAQTGQMDLGVPIQKVTPSGKPITLYRGTIGEVKPAPVLGEVPVPPTPAEGPELVPSPSTGSSKRKPIMGVAAEDLGIQVTDQGVVSPESGLIPGTKPNAKGRLPYVMMNHGLLTPDGVVVVGMEAPKGTVYDPAFEAAHPNLPEPRYQTGEKPTAHEQNTQEILDALKAQGMSPDLTSRGWDWMKKNVLDPLGLTSGIAKLPVVGGRQALGVSYPGVPPALRTTPDIMIHEGGPAQPGVETGTRTQPRVDTAAHEVRHYSWKELNPTDRAAFERTHQPMLDELNASRAKEGQAPVDMEELHAMVTGLEFVKQQANLKNEGLFRRTINDIMAQRAVGTGRETPEQVRRVLNYEMVSRMKKLGSAGVARPTVVPAEMMQSEQEHEQYMAGEREKVMGRPKAGGLSEAQIQTAIAKGIPEELARKPVDTILERMGGQFANRKAFIQALGREATRFHMKKTEAGGIEKAEGPTTSSYIYPVPAETTAGMQERLSSEYPHMEPTFTKAFRQYRSGEEAPAAYPEEKTLLSDLENIHNEHVEAGGPIKLEGLGIKPNQATWLLKNDYLRRVPTPEGARGIHYEPTFPTKATPIPTSESSRKFPIQRLRKHLDFRGEMRAGPEGATMQGIENGIQESLGYKKTMEDLPSDISKDDIINYVKAKIYNEGIDLPRGADPNKISDADFQRTAKRETQTYMQHLLRERLQRISKERPLEIKAPSGEYYINPEVQGAGGKAEAEVETTESGEGMTKLSQAQKKRQEAAQFYAESSKHAEDIAAAGQHELEQQQQIAYDNHLAAVKSGDVTKINRSYKQLESIWRKRIEQRGGYGEQTQTVDRMTLARRINDVYNDKLHDLENAKKMSFEDFMTQKINPEKMTAAESVTPERQRQRGFKSTGAVKDNPFNRHYFEAQNKNHLIRIIENDLDALNDLKPSLAGDETWKDFNRDPEAKISDAEQKKLDAEQEIDSKFHGDDVNIKKTLMKLGLYDTTDVNSPEFKDWFGRSQVKMGEAPAHVYPVEKTVSKPGTLRVGGKGYEHGRSMEQESFHAKIEQPAGLEEVQKAMKTLGIDPEETMTGAKREMLFDQLKKQGHDGIIDTRITPSIIPFEEAQVRPGRKAHYMAGEAEGAGEGERILTPKERAQAARERATPIPSSGYQQYEKHRTEWLEPMGNKDLSTTNPASEAKYNAIQSYLHHGYDSLPDHMKSTIALLTPPERVKLSEMERLRQDPATKAQLERHESGVAGERETGTREELQQDLHDSFMSGVVENRDYQQKIKGKDLRSKMLKKPDVGAVNYTRSRYGLSNRPYTDPSYGTHEMIHNWLTDNSQTVKQLIKESGLTYEDLNTIHDGIPRSRLYTAIHDSLDKILAENKSGDFSRPVDANTHVNDIYDALDEFAATWSGKWNSPQEHGMAEDVLRKVFGDKASSAMFDTLQEYDPNSAYYGPKGPAQAMFRAQGGPHGGTHYMLGDKIEQMLSPQFDKVGKLNEDVGQAFKDTESQTGLYRGKAQAALYDLSKYNQNDINTVANAHREKWRKNTALPAFTPDQQAISGILKNYYHDFVGQERRNLGMTISGRTPALNEHYVPDMMNTKALDTIANRPTSVEGKRLTRLWENYLVNEGMLPAQAADAVKNYQRALSGSHDNYLSVKFGAIREAEGLGLPPELREQNAFNSLQRYGRRAATDMAMYKWLESDPNVRDRLGLRDPNTGITTPHADDISGEKDVQNAMKWITGDFTGRTHAAESPKITGTIKLIHSALLGPATGIRDIATVPVNSIPYIEKFSDLGAALKGLANLRANSRAALESGANMHNMDRKRWSEVMDAPNVGGEFLNNAASWMRLLQGREHMERFSRNLTFSMGKEMAKNNLTAAIAGDAKAQAWLNKFGDAVEGDIKTKSGTDLEDALNTTAKNFSDRVQGTYGGRGLSTSTLEGPLAPYLTMAKWGIEKQNVIYKDVIKPALEGKNYLPLLTYGLGSVMTGAGIQQLNTVLSGKKSREPNIKEVIKEGRPQDYVAQLASLMQLGSFGGITGDTAKQITDMAIYGKANRSIVSFPTMTTVGDLGTSIGHMAEALNAGENPVQVIGKFMIDNTMKNIQAARIAGNYLQPEKTERSDRFRDREVFNMLRGRPAPPDIRANPYMNIEDREFKRTKDVGEAVRMLPEIIQRKIEKAQGDPYRLAQLLQGLKTNNYQTVPNPQTQPIDFRDFMNFLTETQGADEAHARMSDFMMQQIINEAKSKGVPTLPVGHNKSR